MRFRTAAISLGAFFAAGFLAQAQPEAAGILSDPALDLRRPADRAGAVRRLKDADDARMREVRARGLREGRPLRSFRENGRVEELVDFHPDGRPVYLTTHNANAAISTGASLIRVSPYSLSGSGVNIGVWDGGSVRSSHQEFGTRVTLGNASVAAVDHATHVAGTLIAAGTVASARGMANSATVESYDWTSDTSEMTAAASATATDGKMKLSNHSYGTICGWSYVNGGSPYRLWQWYGTGTNSTAVETDFGLYNATSAGQDSLAFNAPYYLIFRSAGNDRGENPANGDAVFVGSSVVTYDSTLHPAGDSLYRGGFETISYAALAKNVITIGSAADAVTSGQRDPAKALISSFSSWGPTDDGRIKPDVVANGESVYSSISTTDSSYAYYNGTSMASPNACGSAALLIQQHAQLFPGQGMRSSTLKGLLIHTADDLGNAGPDYKTGWGLVNVKASADLIQDHYAFPLKQRMIENQISTAVQTRTHTFVWDGVSPIRATLCWIDPAGTSTFTSDDRTPKLRNNLNMTLSGPGGTTHLPFVMPFVGTWTQASMDLPATTGINQTDNVEQIRVASPVAGTYQIVVSYTGTLVNNSQNYSLILTGSANQTTPPPDAPGGLVATPGNSSVTLSWNSSVGATSYNVKRSLTSGGPYSVVGSPYSNSFTDSPLTNGVTYHYVVSALNSYGESTDSGEASALPAATPSTLTLVSSPAGSGEYGSPVTLTATVAQPGATGTVTFREGTTVLGSSAVQVSGQANFSISSLPLGAHSLTAGYSGDAVYGPSNASAVVFTVVPKPVTIANVSASGKTYDATTQCSLQGGTVSGVVGGETVTVVPGSGSFVSPDAGIRAITATGYSITGTHAGNYVLASQPAVPPATILPLPLQVSGGRTYDGTTQIAGADLSATNNLDGANLLLAGTGMLDGKDAGSRLLRTTTVATKVQSATGNTGSNTSSSFSVTLPNPPASGNTLIALISTRGTSGGQVTSISQSGAVWTRAVQATNSVTNGCTTEIWYAPGVSSASSTLTVQQANVRSAAVVVEYSGILTQGALDGTATATGSSASPGTGTTFLTDRTDEVWIAGIGIAGSSPSWSTTNNGFSLVTSAQSTRSQTSQNAKVFALERLVNPLAGATSGGTLNTSAAWAGAIATFRTVVPGTLALSGSAAGNYTLAGTAGSVLIAPKPITVTAGVLDKTYDGNTNATLAPGAALQTAIAPGTGTSTDGKPHSSDSLSLTGTPTASFGNPHASTGKAVTITGYSLTGAQSANYTLLQPAGLTATISPRPVTITAVTYQKTYDGGTTAGLLPTIQPEISVYGAAFTLSQAFASPDAGTGKEIIPSISISDGQGGANFEVTRVSDFTGVVLRAPASISLGALIQTHDGSEKTVTVTTDPASLAVSVTYNGSPQAPSAPGTYNVLATITDPNHEGSASATLVIEAGNTLQAWIEENFNLAQRNAGIAAETADPDGDGLPNLAEYALGTDPRAFTPPHTAVRDENGLSLTFTRPQGLPDVTYSAESSDGLGNWNPIPIEVISTGTTETVRARDPLTSGDASKRFIRLKFTAN